VPGRFRLDEIEDVGKEVSTNAQYPIRNSNELLQALGGENATIKGRKAAEARRIPDEMYPIESPEDFVAKMATLRARGGDEVEGMPRGQQMDALPPDAGQPPQIPDSEKLPRGKAGYKGWKK